MIQKHARAAAGLLCLLLCAACLISLVSCGNGPAETSEPAASTDDGTSQEPQTSTAPLDPYKNADGKYTLDGVNMPAFDFGESEFRVLVYSNHVQGTYFSEEIEPDLYETTDSVLNEAVRTRNDLMTERYGVTIRAIPVDSVATSLRESITTSTDICDAAMPFFSDCAVLAQDGMLYDLKQFDKYLHLDAPWWDQMANKTLSVDNRLYFTTGDISIMQKIVSSAIMFNKTLYDQLLADKYGSLYDLVKNHLWTFDVLYEMNRNTNRNLDDDPELEASKDFFGFGASTGNAISFYLGFGQHIIDKDENDLPKLVFGETESSITLSQTILSRLSEPETFLISEDYKGKVTNCWEYCLAAFGENRNVMRTTAFSAVKKLRYYDGLNPFGIIPFPLADSTQEDYYTPCGGSAYGVCIPVNVQNADFSAYMLEAMCCEGKNTITPAYYETTLKSRDLSYDDESGEMLDQYIFKNMMYDLANVYNFGGIQSMLQNLAAQKSTAVVSSLDSIRSQVQVAIDNCVDAYRSDVNS